MKTASLIFAFLLTASSVFSQTTVSDKAEEQRKALTQQLVGTWSLVLVDNILPNASRVHLYGERPEGLLMFDASGRYSLQIVRTDRSKFKANDKSKGTPEENKALVLGSNSHFGTYRINDDQTITFTIERSSYPNWDGTEQKRSFTIIGDVLKYIVPNPTTDKTAIGEVEWKRIK